AEVSDLTVEVLTSDFEGREESLLRVLASRPDVFNHNIETVRRLTPEVRAKATYDRSLCILRKAASSGPSKIKSGMMVGLGEAFPEIEETLSDLYRAGVRLVTIGQYLQPSANHLAIQKFYTMDEFKAVKKISEKFAFEKV